MLRRFAVFAIALCAFAAGALAPCTKSFSAEENMEKRLKLFVNDNGAAGASLDGRTVVDGLSPVVFLPSAAIKPGAGLEFKNSAADSGRDYFGAFDSLTLTYSGKGGEIKLVLRARQLANGNIFIFAGIDNPGKVPLRPEPSLGVLASLPGLQKAQGTERFSQFWTRPFFAESTTGIKPHTQFLLWKDVSGGFGAMIPLVGNGLRGMLETTEGFGAYGSSFDFSFKPKGIVPLLAIAIGPDPYAAVQDVYAAGMHEMGSPGRLRSQKPYPDVFEYFGWCSWNAFYSAVYKDALVQAAKSFKKAKFPLRYMIIDDGWQSEKDRRLTAFEANQKFPGGLPSIVSILKKDYGITWVGVWHAYQGYWNGVSADSDLAKKYKKNLLDSFVKALIPDPTSDAGFKFYYDYHESMRKAGVDLVKVDNQSTMSVFSQNIVPIASAMQQQQKNLQASVNLNFNGRIINCMDMTSENIYFWLTSNIARNSDDFFPEREGNARVHILHNVYNSLWMSQLAWPDFDMFQSHHPQAQMHAVLRAVSGGPIYTTDTPGKQVWDILWKFILPDGKLLRADAPLLPSPASLFDDPTRSDAPLKAFNTVGRAGVLAVFNVKDDGGAVAGTVSSADVPPLKGARFAVYEHFSGKLVALAAGKTIPVELKEYQPALYTFVPIENGFAPIGLADKFLSPRTVLRADSAPGEFAADLAAPGEFVAWVEKKPAAVTVNGKPVAAKAFTWNGNVFRIKLDAAATAPIVVKIKTGK